jgi:hypothetical protein
MMEASSLNKQKGCSEPAAASVIEKSVKVIAWVLILSFSLGGMFLLFGGVDQTRFSEAALK